MKKQLIDCYWGDLENLLQKKVEEAGGEKNRQMRMRAPITRVSHLKGGGCHQSRFWGEEP